MWIAQPGEAVFEWVTKWHNVWATAEHPITKKAYSIAYAICEQVRAIHKNPVRVITYVVQKDSPHATDWLLASVSRIVSSQIGPHVSTLLVNTLLNNLRSMHSIDTPYDELSLLK
jgi:hypothetical protein